MSTSARRSSSAAKESRVSGSAGRQAKTRKDLCRARPAPWSQRAVLPIPASPSMTSATGASGTSSRNRLRESSSSSLPITWLADISPPQIWPLTDRIENAGPKEPASRVADRPAQHFRVPAGTGGCQMITRMERATATRAFSLPRRLTIPGSDCARGPARISCRRAPGTPSGVRGEADRRSPT